MKAEKALRAIEELMKKWRDESAAERMVEMQSAVKKCWKCGMQHVAPERVYRIGDIVELSPGANNYYMIAEKTRERGPNKRVGLLSLRYGWWDGPPVEVRNKFYMLTCEFEQLKGTSNSIERVDLQVAVEDIYRE